MPVKRLLTCEEFEKLAPHLGVCELVDGEVIELSPAGFPQAFVAGRIFKLLANFVEVRNLGWVLTNEPGFHVNREKHRE